VTQLIIVTQLTIINRGSEFFYSVLWLNILIFLCFCPWPEALPLLDL
jgi:hypothetical protein